MFVVMVTVSEGDEAEPVGPFPDAHWAARYIERVRKLYHSFEMRPLLSPILLGDVGDEQIGCVFDPTAGVDR